MEIIISKFFIYLNGKYIDYDISHNMQFMVYILLCVTQQFISSFTLMKHGKIPGNDIFMGQEF